MLVAAAAKANAFGALVSECELILMFFICRKFWVFVVCMYVCMCVCCCCYCCVISSLFTYSFVSFSLRSDFSILIERNQERTEKRAEHKNMECRLICVHTRIKIIHYIKHSFCVSISSAWVQFFSCVFRQIFMENIRKKMNHVTDNGRWEFWACHFSFNNHVYACFIVVRTVVIDHVNQRKTKN